MTDNRWNEYTLRAYRAASELETMLYSLHLIAETEEQRKTWTPLWSKASPLLWQVVKESGHKPPDPDFGEPSEGSDADLYREMESSWTPD